MLNVSRFQSLCIQFKFTFSPLSFDTCLLSFISHLLPRIILSTSEEACCREKTVCQTNNLRKTQLLNRQILTCQKQIQKFNYKTNNLSLNIRPDSQKNFKDERRGKLQHKSPCEHFSQRLAVILMSFLVHEQTKIKLKVI